MEISLPIEKDLSQYLNNCPNCGSFCQNNYSILQTLPEVRMIKCGECKLAYANKFPKESYLEQLYNPKIYQSNLTSDIKKTSRLAKKIFKIFNFNKKNISILDYGGGNGNLSYMLLNLFEKKNIKANILIVDIYNSCTHQDIRFEHVQDFKKNNEKFDIVLASAVLEHLPNFTSITSALLDRVSTYGFFYCRTPWEFEISKIFKFYKIKWPRHLYDIGGDYWFRYFKKKNYTILLSNTSITEISNKQIFKYIFAQLLKTISRIETYMFKNNMFYDPKWPYVGGWDLIVKKND